MTIKRETEWKPSDEEIEWTRDNLEPLQIGGVWSPHGLEYERSGESELTLIAITSHEGTIEAHARVTKVLDEIGWVMVDDSVQRVTNDLDPASLEEAREQELERIQEIVQGWQCSNEDCEEHLVNMPLDKVLWVNHGPQDFVDPQSGEEGKADRWLAELTCHKCNSIIPMNPLDFGYIGGEDLFYTWKSNVQPVQFRVLTREQTVELIDSGGKGIALGSTYLDESVPPHMQGTFCLCEYSSDEEE